MIMKIPLKKFLIFLQLKQKFLPEAFSYFTSSTESLGALNEQFQRNAMLKYSDKDKQDKMTKVYRTEDVPSVVMEQILE